VETPERHILVDEVEAASMKKTRVANGIYYVEIPEADLRILCGCPADSVKHLIKGGLISTVTANGSVFETGPNAILLSDTSAQKGSFANLCEFPLLQMFYRQGMAIPGHPNNRGRRPILIGLGDQVRSQGEYFFRGNYGLSSIEEIEACGIPTDTAREMFLIKKWFAFDSIRPTAQLVETRALDAEAVELAPGVVVHRKGFNRYEFLAGGRSVEVDLSLGPGEEFEPSYRLPPGGILREPFSVIHLGEGDGWDPARPCMGSLVCFKGLLYLVDAGPHIMHSLEALGIDAGEIEGIFHTHTHDDHFAGLTSLVRSERRMKYFAAPCVRATAQKKLAALMRTDEERFARFFEVHDLLPGEWNGIGDLQVRPVFSPHPVETTILFFRAPCSEGTRTYAHLADIASFSVLEKLAARRNGQSALTEASRAAFVSEMLAPVDLKKIDVGGGLIHGDASDFVSDRSRRIVLSHGLAAMPDAMKGIGITVSFGDTDTLIAGSVREQLLDNARKFLSSWFPGAPPSEIEALANCPIQELAPGAIVHTPGAPESDLRLILSGIAHTAESRTEAQRRFTAGTLVGSPPGHPGDRGAVVIRATSAVTVLSIPARAYTDFIARANLSNAVQTSVAYRGFLSLCPLFSGIVSESILNGLAAAMEKRTLIAGQVAVPTSIPELLLLAEGEVDLAVGAHLVESIGPGGFWGEERIASAAAVICEARAVTDCVYFAISADLLSEIPIAQWELLETFERRLKSFRTGFRFDWSESFRVEVKELDDQHRKLFALVNDLSELVGHSGLIAGHDAKKKELLEFTRFHFESEEALMEKNAYPRIEMQKKAHAELLARLERFVGAGERRARPRAETIVDYLKDWLIRHTLLEDLIYREFFREKGIH
jgi:hemerythrin